MAANVIFRYIILCQGVAVLGTLINPQLQPGKPSLQVHCLATNKPIQIKDPFDRRLIEDTKFIAMEWYRLVPTSSDEGVKETLLIQFLKNQTRILQEKSSVFDFWGLQIHNVGLEDSATYKAKLVHLSQGKEWSVTIVVSTPPVLTSETLSVSRSVDKDGQSVTLSCGHLASLGSPPVPLVWETENGTVLPGNYKDGYITLTIPSDEDAGKYSCRLNKSSSAARCILDIDAPRFREVLTAPSGPESADVTGVIIGVVLGVLVVLVIIAVVVFIKMRRQAKSETYNAREQETRRDAELGRANGVALFKEEEDRHGKLHRPIYKGVDSADSFMISKVSEGGSDLIFQKINPQMAPSKNTEYLNGDKSDLNGHKSQPPQKSPRAVKQEGDRTKQIIESDKKKRGKLETHGLKGKEDKLHEVQPKSVLKHANGTQVNGIAKHDNASNGTPSNGVAGSGILSHGTLV